MIKLRCSWRRMKASNCVSLIVRLAMVSNDISHAYLLLGLTKDYEANKKPPSYCLLRQTLEDSDLRFGLRIYAFRMLIGHFREGVKIIGEIGKREQTERNQNGGELSSYLNRLNKETYQGYENLKLFYSDPAQKDKFSMLVRNLRDEVGFHYGDKRGYIAECISNLANDNAVSVNALIFSREQQTSSFPIANTVISNIIGKFIWKVERADQADTEEAIEIAMKWCNGECNTLLQLCSELCGLYFVEHNAI